MFCDVCRHFYRGGDSSRCPECESQQTFVVDEQEWWATLRRRMVLAQKYYLEDLVFEQCQVTGIERFHNRFDPLQEWPDVAEAYLTIFLKSLDAQLQIILQLFLKTVRIDESKEAIHAVINQCEYEACVGTNCPEQCKVEPDGYCPHGYDALTIVHGLL